MILLSYGGIYVDTNVYVVNSLDKYRKFEMTLAWNVENKSISSNVIIANPHARLLYAFFDHYRFDFEIK